MIKLYKGQRMNYTLRVTLADFKTIISPAHCMMFWFYIKLPGGTWSFADIRQLQEPELRETSDPNDRFHLIVKHELELIKEFEGKTDEQHLQIIADKIFHLPIGYFISTKLEFKSPRQ